MTKDSSPKMPATRPSGFTLLEVMVAMLVLAFGLLGFAMLQTTSVRMSQSSNYRTYATNLASELLDQMRANRSSASDYASAATFVIGNVESQACIPTVNQVQDVAANAALWKCRVVRALGESAIATVTYNDNDEATISLTWGERSGDQATSTFVVTTRL